jgi:Holliday junction resolvase RusA-like endonuclease
MSTHTYTITLEPRGKGRPVFTRATGHARTPDTTRAWEHEAAHQLREQHIEHGGEPLDTVSALWAVEVLAYHRRPRTRPAHIPKAAWADKTGNLPATSRHDLDNIVKIVLDALQIARVIENDRCIVAIDARSYYVGVNDHPCVDVVLEEVVL